MPLPRRLVCALAVIGALQACATPPRVRRELDTGHRHADRRQGAVVLVDTECSGVLTTERWVVTAAHCVWFERPEAVLVAQGGRRERFAVTRCVLHPRAGAEGCGRPGPELPPARSDLAMLELERPVDVSLAAPLPLVLNPPASAEASWPRDVRVRVYGWHRRPAVVGAARRYGGLNWVTAVTAGAMTTAPARADGFATRSGASGGPAVMRIGGRPHIAGVLFGGVTRRSRASVFATTFDPSNSGFLASVLGRDLPEDLAHHDPTAPAPVRRPRRGGHRAQPAPWKTASKL